jgi:hypothetical protein
MFSKKYFILQKARSEFEKRIEQGEDINFNFTFKENTKAEEFNQHASIQQAECGSTYQQQKRRKLSKYTGAGSMITTEVVGGNSSKMMSNVQLEEEPELISYDEFFQQYKTQQGVDAQIKPITCSPNVSPTHDIAAANSEQLPIASTRKRGGKKSASNGPTNTNASATNGQSVQGECCLIGCHNSVTNRLRFSLRCHKNEDFKQDFLENGWNKVCHYHYFSDLYKYKKMTHGTAKNGNNTTTNKKVKSSSPVPEVTLGKRSRKTFEQVQPQPVAETPAIETPAVDQRLEDANVFVHFLMTTKQGGDM